MNGCVSPRQQQHLRNRHLRTNRNVLLFGMANALAFCGGGMHARRAGMVEEEQTAGAEHFCTRAAPF